jgi:hypothetical protein
MADVPYIASHPNYPQFEHLLSSGWIPGRKVVRDSSAQQETAVTD